MLYFACVKPKMTVKLIVKLIVMFTSHQIDVGAPKSRSRGSKRCTRGSQDVAMSSCKSKFAAPTMSAKNRQKIVAGKTVGTNLKAESYV